MKNLKKIAALGLAAAVSMSVGVSAFAEVTATSANANFGSYENGIAKLNANQTILDDTNQWTVVIIDADKANTDLSADDLYYINQGTGTEGFWVTNGMGTKVDLTTLVSETNPTKDFIIRIGTDKVETIGVQEINFTLKYSSGSVEIIIGDVTGDTKINSDDAIDVLKYAIGMITLTENQLDAADVTNDGKINSDDAIDILKYAIGMITSFAKK